MNDEARNSTRSQILLVQEYFVALENRQVVDLPEASRVAMFGPHADDIVLGAGGLAIKYAAAGIPVFFNCLTDGRACVADVDERQRMVEVRAAEERSAGEICGVAGVEIMGFREDRFAETSQLDHQVREVARVIAEQRPDVVFIPHWFEVHPWHRYANHLLALALQQSEIPDRVFAYQVISLVPPAFVVDISQVLEQKIKAVRAYESQLAMRNYERDVRMLAAMHAPLAEGGAQGAEVFFGMARSEYVERMGALELHAEQTLGCGIQPVVPAAGPED